MQSDKLFNKNFLLLFQGQTVSILGSKAFIIAQFFWIKEMTNSSATLGLLMMCSALPGVILGPFGGAIADRFSKKWIIVFSDLLLGFAVGIFFFLLYFTNISDQSALNLLFLIAILMGVVGSTFGPAVQSLVPDLVNERNLPKAIALNSSSRSIASIIGDSAGGVLLSILGAPILFLFDSISYLLSGLSEIFIEEEEQLEKNKSSFKDVFYALLVDTKGGFNYVFSQKGLANTVLSTLIINIFIIPIFILLPFYVEDILMLNVSWYGYFLSAIGLGSLAGALFAGVIRLSQKRLSFLVATLLLSIWLVLMGIAYSDNAFLSLFLFFLHGLFISFINVKIMTTIHINTESSYRGRVMGVLRTFATGINPIVFGVTGIISESLDNDIRLVYFSSALIGLFLCLLLVRNFYLFFTSNFPKLCS